MKIVLVGYNPRNIGGIESFSRNLKESIFPELNFLYEYDQKGPFEVNDFIGVCKYNFFNRFLNKISRGLYTKNKIKSYLKSKEFDLILLNTPKYLDIIDDLSKVILIQHTTVDNWWLSEYKFNKSNKLLSLAKKVKKIVSLSEEEKKQIINKFHIDKNKIKVINLPSGLEYYNKIKEPGRNLLMLTRFQNEIKRIDLVINAMKNLPDFNLNIYGSGKDEKELRLLAEKYSNVKIYNATTEKLKILDENHIYILSSDFEGYPVSLIEAASRKLPLIIRNTFPSATEIVNHNGILLKNDWNQSEFCEAVHNIYHNYYKYSESSEEIYNKHSPLKIKQQWLLLTKLSE
ncbi:glycosyltransferase [Proteus vulgaris]|uniref:glycosyltransferase n=1 Tax=Proteus vulgaris TaxID=585 RepID=UPI00235FBF51|nr:glycosyltransferase [Proteus vulgaris]